MKAHNTHTQGLGVERYVFKDEITLLCRSRSTVKACERIVQSQSSARHKRASLIPNRSFDSADLDLRSRGTRLDQENENQAQEGDGTTV